MRVSSQFLERDSENELASELHALSDAGAGVIQIRTGEIQRCLDALRLAVTVDRAVYKEWDIVNGWREFDVQNRNDPDVTGDKKVNFAAELMKPDEARREARQNNRDDAPLQYFVYVCPQYWEKNNPVYAHLIRHYGRELPAADIRVILVTPDMPVDEMISDSVVTMRFNPPGHGELRRYLDGILGDLNTDEVELTDDEKDGICHAGAGMGQEQFEMYSSISVVETNNTNRENGTSEPITATDIQAGVNSGKTEIVNKNDLLELYPVEDIHDVGGLDLLKEWIEKRRECYTEEAAEFGIESPKGIVNVGPPGTGKSLIAKAIAGVLNVPLIRLDFGKVFNSLVGSSEERIRTALRMVSYMAPCVLFVDEIDKGLGGIGGGGGDSGTSSRVLGTFLTWLQDNQAPVFTMVTANNIRGLPPELMRKGRFDEIFASSLPDDVDRRTILDIHLRKRGWDLAGFPEQMISRIVNASIGHSGAEIEAAVKEGLIDAFHDGRTRKTMDLGYVLRAVEGTTPLSKAYKEEIQAMTVWSKQHARAASKTRKKTDNVTDIAPARKRIRTRRKPTDGGK